MNVIEFAKFYKPQQGYQALRENSTPAGRASRYRTGDKVKIIYGHRAGSTGVVVRHAIDKSGNEIHSILIDGLGLMAIERADYIQPFTPPQQN